MLTVTTTSTYSATCETEGCTASWTGSDPAQATGWVLTYGSWPLGAPQPTTTKVHCPAHAG